MSLPLFYPPTQLWTAVGTWWPSVLTMSHAATFTIKVLYLGLYSPVLYMPKTVCPLCSLSAPQTFSSPASCTEQVSRVISDHLGWRLWWFQPPTETAIIYHAWSCRDRLQSHFAVHEFSFDFSIPKCGIIQICWSKSTSPLLLDMLLSSAGMQCAHNNSHMADFCLCGFYPATRRR